MRYYIYDCYNQIVGNPKGYATYTGAARQEKRLYPMLWDRLDAMKDFHPTAKLVCCIKLQNGSH